MIPVLLGVSLIGFLLIYISPGDAVDSIVAQGGVYSEEDVMKLREEFGLDQPFLVHNYNYVKGIVTEFDFGTDYLTKRPVTSEILERFPTTLILACLGVLVAVIIGIPAGIISATKQYSLFDNIVTPISHNRRIHARFLAGASTDHCFLRQARMAASIGILWAGILDPAFDHNRNFCCRVYYAHDPIQYAGGYTAGLYPHSQGQRAI